MSKTSSHTGALYAKISGELYAMDYTAKDVQELRNTLKFHDSLMVKQQAKIVEQGATIQKLLQEKIELCAKVEELQTEITDIQCRNIDIRDTIAELEESETEEQIKDEVNAI